MNRQDYGFIGYYSMTGCPSLDLLEINLFTNKAIISYFGSNDVYETDICWNLYCNGRKVCMSISISDENTFKYDILSFRLAKKWVDFIITDLMIEQNIKEGKIWISN